jgi:hypothetical protein
MHEQILSYTHPQLFKLMPNPTPRAGGFQVLFRFRNGYGASVIQHDMSYGRESGQYELAVARWNGDDDDDWSICYTTDVTSDVLGYLESSDVRSVLDRLGNLPPDAFALPGANLD